MPIEYGIPVNNERSPEEIAQLVESTWTYKNSDVYYLSHKDKYAVAFLSTKGLISDKLKSFMTTKAKRDEYLKWSCNCVKLIKCEDKCFL